MVVSLLMGCAGAGKSTLINPAEPIGFPAPLPPASSNSFTGTQGPGVWTVALDDTQQKFSSQATTYPSTPNAPTSGSFLLVSGFYALKNSTGTPGGYAVEVPGRALALQPGSNTVAPVLAVEQDSCFPLNGTVRFGFVHMPNPLLPTGQNGGYATYGSIAARTNADGSVWMFGDQAHYVQPYTLGAPGIGVPIAPGTPAIAQANYLEGFSASCSVTNGQAHLTAAPNVSSSKPASTNPTTFVIGSTGFLVADQSTGKQTPQVPDATSFVGVVQPASPIATANLVASRFTGFLEETNGTAGSGLKTEPIGFGQVIAGSGSSMTGGVYLNDDITQFQNSNIVLNLGTQDPANNGLYPLASITVPDPKNVCFIDPTTGHNGAGGTPGVDQFNNETCTFNAVAVVGNPENRFAIFITSYDVTTNLSMGMYLFQQN